MKNEGTIDTVLVTVQDITRRKSLESQLIQAQKMESIGRLAGGVAHDYNNALTAIMGFAELAMMEADPKGAMKFVQKHTGRIHLLITDVIMPEMNGRELSEQLQSLFPDLKCIFMSGYTANAIAHKGVLDEGVHFVQKPFSKNDLAIIVRKVLEMKTLP